MFLTVKHDFAFLGGENVWYDMLFQGSQFYGPLKFVPLSGGVLLAVAQYFPETINRRIKLTFHLPLNENNAILMMQAFGGGCLLLSFSLIYGTFFVASLYYFPVQIVTACAVSVFPWFLAGFAAYFLVGLIVLEPIWKFRFGFLLIAGFWLSVYLNDSVLEGYRTANDVLLLLTVLLGVSPLFSAYRFRKGEM